MLSPHLLRKTLIETACGAKELREFGTQCGDFHRAAM